jgi:catalase
VRDAFGHLKAIALDAGGRRLFEAAGLSADEAVFDAKNRDGFIAAAKTRLWAREPRVRTLA